ncbi:unnamed protein product [Ophioblennius macclurei]
MALFLLILGVVLLPEVYALKCYQCSSDDSCTAGECVPGLVCIASRMTIYTGNQKPHIVNRRGCGKREDCIQGSINHGKVRTVLTADCCSNNLCNNQSATDPSLSNPNGKKCFFCNGLKCTGTLNCLGNEDHCISATANTAGTLVKVKGCASKEMCSALNVPELSDMIDINMKCCQGDFCNSASSTSTGLLLLGVPLISLVLFA